MPTDSKPSPPAAPAAICAALLIAAAATAAAAAASPPPVRLDCRADSAACPEVTIEGDPFFQLPGLGWSPFRGYGDPSLRRDPASGRLWLSYSYLSVHPWPSPEFGVGIHLASSDDGGASWRFERVLARSAGELDPAPPGGLGVSVHEVSTLAPLGDGAGSRWFGMHLRYFQPFGEEDRRPGSLHFRLGRSGSPLGLGWGRGARLAGPITDPAWGTDLDLSTLHPDLAGCAAWTEPALYGLDGTLYLVAQCLVVDLATGARRPGDEFLGVFASAGRGPLRQLEWSWRGRLTDRRDARALGGQVLTQPDVARARDGSLLLLVTPKRLFGGERHKGCRALELESLDPPRLRRNAAGRPVVRADIRSSDSTGLGPGLCAYDPASSTGICSSAPRSTCRSRTSSSGCTPPESTPEDAGRDARHRRLDSLREWSIGMCDGASSSCTRPASPGRSPVVAATPRRRKKCCNRPT